MSIKKTVAIAAAAAALTALALPAMAETTLYGSARMSAFWNTVDVDSAVGSNTDFNEHLQGNSRFGAKFANGNMTGRVELGTGVNLRLLYGSYKFDFGSVLVGQDYNKYWVGSEQVYGDDNGNNSYGSLWDTRQPQVRVQLNNGLYLAAIQPSTISAPTTTENYLPKLNVGYDGKIDNFSYGVGVVGQSYKVQVATTGDTGGTITSLMGYAHGKFTAGPAAVVFNLGIGQNMGDMGFTSISGKNKFAVSGNKIEDTTNFEGMVQGSYTVSPMVKLNAGVGYVLDKNDTYLNDDNLMAIFVNAPITVAKGFTVVPEISYVDELDNAANNANGNKTYAVGAKLQMDF
ncbi:MAG: hypothetical protein PHY09_01640 [Desulfuromonadaceae bacterium]|nr:hypothetical protein [Desulfuromonadaceae bacterium]MDD5105177.1 hypothetical protein [Desulfuromonadaceae bacterium]